MSKEFVVRYTINGKGFTPTEPWVDHKGEDEAAASERFRSLVSHLETNYSAYEAWIDERAVGPWVPGRRVTKI